MHSFVSLNTHLKMEINAGEPPLSITVMLARDKAFKEGLSELAKQQLEFQDISIGKQLLRGTFTTGGGARLWILRGTLAVP